MNQEAFIKGFTKQASTKGITVIEAQRLLKVAGWHDMVRGVGKNLRQMWTGTKELVGANGNGWHPINGLWNIGSGLAGTAAQPVMAPKNLIMNSPITHGLTAGVKSLNPWDDRSVGQIYDASVANSANNRAAKAEKQYSGLLHNDKYWDPSGAEYARKEMGYQAGVIADASKQVGHGDPAQAKYYQDRDTQTLQPLMQERANNILQNQQSNSTAMTGVTDWAKSLQSGKPTVGAPIKPPMLVPKPLAPEQAPTIQGFGNNNNPININRPI